MVESLSCPAQRRWLATEPGVDVLLLGLLAAVTVSVIGHSNWVYRRARGPLRSADDDVKELVGSKPDRT